jgi:biopolymer transport protein ExbB/TolQ
MYQAVMLMLAGQTSSDSFMIQLVKAVNPILEPVVFGVLFLLLALSAISWAIIYYKWRALHRAQNQSIEFLEAFWSSKRLDAIFTASEKTLGSPISQVFRAGYVELSMLKKTQA